MIKTVGNLIILSKGEGLEIQQVAWDFFSVSFRSAYAPLHYTTKKSQEEKITNLSIFKIIYTKGFAYPVNHYFLLSLEIFSPSYKH